MTYPSQVNQLPGTPVDESASNKQIPIIIIAILAMTASWWSVIFIGNQLSQKALLPETTSLTWFHLIGMYIIVYSLLIAISSLSALLIKNFWLRLLPFLIAPLIIFATSTNIIENLFFIFIALLSSLLFSTTMTPDTTLFRKFSFSRIVNPHAHHLLLGLAIINVIPMFFMLKSSPQIVKSYIDNQLIGPAIDFTLSATGAIINEQTDQATSQIALPEIIPTQLEQFVTPEMLAQLQGEIDNVPQNVEIITDDAITDIKDQLKLKLIEQMDKFTQPIAPYWHWIIPALFGFTIFQIALLIKPLLILPAQLLFKILTTTKIVRIETENQPVEVLKL